jgi:hypothetical protein
LEATFWSRDGEPLLLHRMNRLPRCIAFCILDLGGINVAPLLANKTMVYFLNSMKMMMKRIGVINLLSNR